MSSAGHASEAIFSRLYLADKTVYSRPLCSLQYLSIDAANLARFIGVRRLVSEWQGRELVKSATYPQLSENDQVQLANRKSQRRCCVDAHISPVTHFILSAICRQAGIVSSLLIIARYSNLRRN